MSEAPPSGPQPDADDHEGALPAGTRLDEFEIVRVLGAGGFGIVYLARDHALLRLVAIKEYMPSGLARRGPDLRLSLRRGPHAETFAAGLESFVKEAQLLARFDHPSLVKVYRYWQANGTAYMAMQYYQGRTLQQERRAMVTAPSELWLRGLVYSLLGALDVLHAQGVFHRDISPDNIVLLPDGCPVLLDFGAARHIVGNAPQALTAVFKPNFAPIEQCGEIPGLLQGPWTDLYALGAVLHFMLTGTAPMPAMLRAVHDAMPTLAGPQSEVRRISSTFLASIDWTLGVRPEERPQDAQMLRDAIEGVVQAPLALRRVKGKHSQSGSDAGAQDGPASASWASTVQATTMRVTRPNAPPTASGLPSSPGVVESAVSAGTPGRFYLPTRIGWQGVTTGAALALCVVGLTAWGLGAVSGERAPTPGASIVATPGSPTVISGVAAPGTGLSRLAAPAAQSALLLDTEISREPLAAHDAAAGSRRAKPEMATTESVAPKARREAATVRHVAPMRSANDPTLHAAARADAVAAFTPSPRAACGDRNFFSMAVCMTRECREPVFRNHQECRDFRRYDEARRTQMSR